MKDNTTLYVTVGLPGAGKTTRARQLEIEKQAIRLTPDEWMIPLFGAPGVGGPRDILEGRFIWLAVQAVQRGTNAILDFGVWARDERSALKYVASRSGVNCQLIYFPIDPDEQHRRLAARNTPDLTFFMNEADLAGYREFFQVPSDDELTSTAPGPPPASYSTWEDWIRERWPTALPE